MVLVTGGTGLLGSHLLYYLANQNIKVRALMRPNSSTKKTERTFAYYSTQSKELYDKIEWVTGDMMDYFSLLDAMNDVESVYHCAAKISFSPKDANRMLKENTEGTANVVNACLEKNIKKSCFVSSVAALGQTNTNELITEKTYWKNVPENSIYSVSKYCSEREVWRGIEEGLNAVIVNPSIIIGPGDWTSGSSNMFNSGYKGMKYYSSGVAGFVDVRDVAQIMIALLESNNNKEQYLLNSENVPYKLFFELMHDAFKRPRPGTFASPFLSELVWRAEALRSFFTGANPLITKETVRSAHQKNYFSNEKITKAIGYSFIPIKQSVEETCQLFLKDLQ